MGGILRPYGKKSRALHGVLEKGLRPQHLVLTTHSPASSLGACTCANNPIALHNQHGHTPKLPPVEMYCVLRTAHIGTGDRLLGARGLEAYYAAIEINEDNPTHKQASVPNAVKKTAGKWALQHHSIIAYDVQ